MCLPALHISLGVFYRLYTLLEQAAHELDLAMAREKDGRLDGNTYEHYTFLLQRLHKLEEDEAKHTQAAETLDQLATQMALSVTTETSAAARISFAVEMITKCRQRARELVNQLSGIKIALNNEYIY